MSNCSRARVKPASQGFPDLLDKPVDTPYGPYADGFSEAQHKYGPFAPILAEVARLKAEQKAKAFRATDTDRGLGAQSSVTPGHDGRTLS